MTVLQLPVPEATAQRFEALSTQQQTLVSQLIADWLAEPNSLSDVIDYISFKASGHGLTPEILQQLLEE